MKVAGVAAVTGAGGGIGFAAAVELARRCFAYPPDRSSRWW